MYKRTANFLLLIDLIGIVSTEQLLDLETKSQKVCWFAFSVFENKKKNTKYARKIKLCKVLVHQDTEQ